MKSSEPLISSDAIGHGMIVFILFLCAGLGWGEPPKHNVHFPPPPSVLVAFERTDDVL